MDIETMQKAMYAKLERAMRQPSNRKLYNRWYTLVTLEQAALVKMNAAKSARRADLAYRVHNKLVVASEQAFAAWDARQGQGRHVDPNTVAGIWEERAA